MQQKSKMVFFQDCLFEFFLEMLPKYFFIINSSKKGGGLGKNSDFWQFQPPPIINERSLNIYMWNGDKFERVNEQYCHISERVLLNLHQFSHFLMKSYIHPFPFFQESCSNWEISSSTVNTIFTWYFFTSKGLVCPNRVPLKWFH